MNVLPPYTVTVIAIERAERIGGMLWGLSPGEAIATASAIIALISVVIAGFALWRSIREARRMQKHNQLSVKPLLGIDEKQHYGKGKSEMNFKIMNVGVGPAIVTHFAVFFDHKEFIFPEREDEFKRQIRSAISYPHILGAGYALNMAAGDYHDVLIVEIEKSETEARALGKRVGFEIEYQSIYQNEKFSLIVKNSSGYPKDNSPTRKNQKS